MPLYGKTASGLLVSTKLGGPVFAAGGDADNVLLLHMDGADASTTFTDSAIGGLAPHTIGVGGNAQIDTAQSVFGGASGLFDGTGDYLNVTDGNTDFAFGTGDFTIDMRIRRPEVAAASILYDARPSGVGVGLYPTIYVSAQTVRYYTNGADRIVSGNVLAVDTWYHIAVVRASGTTKLYVDGTQVGLSYTDSNNYLNGASRPVIGAQGSTLGNASFNGWIDEFRVATTAKWTTDFTPPASPYS